MKMSFGNPCQDVIDQLDQLTKDMLEENQRKIEAAWIEMITEESEEES